MLDVSTHCQSFLHYVATGSCNLLQDCKFSYDSQSSHSTSYIAYVFRFQTLMQAHKSSYLYLALYSSKLSDLSLQSLHTKLASKDLPRCSNRVNLNDDADRSYVLHRTFLAKVKGCRPLSQITVFCLHFKTKMPSSLSMSYVSKVFANFNSAFNLSFDMTTTSPCMPLENFFLASSNILFISIRFSLPFDWSTMSLTILNRMQNQMTAFYKDFLKLKQIAS